MKEREKESHEINGEVDEVVRGQGLVIAAGHLLVAVDAVVVQHVQQQLLTAHIFTLLFLKNNYYYWKEKSQMTDDERRPYI